MSHLNPTSPIPLIGLGTWRLTGHACESVVRAALELGYRHIDTADIYQNHREVGQAIQDFPRQDLFLATKLYLTDLTPDKVNSAVTRFLKELRIDYLDLLMIHWPSQEVDSTKTLDAMVRFQEAGIVRFLGVSNFVRSQLLPLISQGYPIAVNQIELHPYFQRRELIHFCSQNNIEIVAYRPLAKGAFEADHTLQEIGQKYNKSPSQVVLRWFVQQNIPTIPKAGSIKHLKENIEIFDFNLNDHEMEQIFQLDKGKRYCAPEGLEIPSD